MLPELIDLIYESFEIDKLDQLCLSKRHFYRKKYYKDLLFYRKHIVINKYNITIISADREILLNMCRPCMFTKTYLTIPKPAIRMYYTTGNRHRVITFYFDKKREVKCKIWTMSDIKQSSFQRSQPNIEERFLIDIFK
jgi:hypothetical protein